MLNRQKENDYVIALSLMGVGLLFVLTQLFKIDIMDLLWPLFVVGPGAVLVYWAAQARGDDWLVWMHIPGMITLGTGLLLLYQNLTGHWESWIYAWSLYGVFLGIAFVEIAKSCPQAEELGFLGRGFIRWSLIVFVAMGGFVELIVANGAERRLILALLFIAGGIYFITREEDLPAKSKPKRELNMGHDGELVYRGYYNEQKGIELQEEEQRPQVL